MSNLPSIFFSTKNPYACNSTSMKKNNYGKGTNWHICIHFQNMFLRAVISLFFADSISNDDSVLKMWSQSLLDGADLGMA